MTTQLQSRVGVPATRNLAAYSTGREPLWRRARILLTYRELVAMLVMRELKARYKNSALGFLWSLLNPLGMMVVFTIVSTFLMPSNQIDKYPIFLLCGLLPWNFFQAGVVGSIDSVVGNANLIKKVYFPREVLPIVSVLAQLVNFLLALVVLFAVLLVFRAHISPWVWALPLVIFVQTLLILGVALILSTLNVFYRDVAMIMEVVMLAWFFLTPIFYPIDVLPRSAELFGITINLHWWMYVINPMSSIISAYRDLLYWGYLTDIYFLSRTVMTSVGVLVVGYWFFLRCSGRFGEEV